MDRFVYRGAKTQQISFPLGGIGSGCIGLAGNGRLVDWEIANRPNKGSVNGYSHFAIKAERNGELLDARVLNGDLAPPCTGDLGGDADRRFGFGPARGTMAGFPHFREAEFTGEFPLARVQFLDGTFPGSISMQAFNPYIPLNDRDSSIPAAFFLIEAENTGKDTLDYTIALSLSNSFSPIGCTNSYTEEDGVHTLTLLGKAYEESDPLFGEISCATDATEVDCQRYWFRGAWFDDLEVYWQDFSAAGPIAPRVYGDDEVGTFRRGAAETGTLAAAITVKPGEKRSVRFVISWHFPNCTNYWNPEQLACDCDSDDACDEKSCDCGSPTTWKNYYATIFANSAESAAYSLANWDQLERQTMMFKEALFTTSMPPAALEAVSANLSTLKTPTCLRLTDGSFYGFEGCHPKSGCCEGSCEHVWNYAYVLPFLFPALERSMRELDYRYNQREDGAMPFRLQLPLGREPSNFRACADGQFGGVIKTYRDWKICGDDEWLRRLWPAVKRSIEYAWAPTNQDRWDRDKDGVLEGRQHHTLDMELFGPNSWLTGFYLGALKAGAEMAEHLGENAAADEFRGLFERGSAWVEAHLFNGRYYHQVIDLTDRSVLDPYVVPSDPDSPARGADVVGSYWNEEAGELKYQIGDGSEIDQLGAQWHANICGLGDVFDPSNRHTALTSLFRYNYKRSMRDFFNPCRIYCLNDEAGLVICDWPEGTYRPAIPLPYSGETQNGYEYQAAILMIQEGLVSEGMEAVTAIRDRYDGEKRNPWNEFECGSNYARSMATYSLVPTFSGFSFDMPHRKLGFDPIHSADFDSHSGSGYSTIWSVDSGWGVFRLDPGVVRLTVYFGSIELSELRLPRAYTDVTAARVERSDETGSSMAAAGVEVDHSGAAVQYSLADRAVAFTSTVKIDAGQTLVLHTGEGARQ